jgi:hypothetical protein
VSFGAATLSGELVVDFGRARASGPMHNAAGAVPAPGRGRAARAGARPSTARRRSHRGRPPRAAAGRQPALRARLPSGTPLPDLSAGPLDLGLEVTGDWATVRGATAVALSLPDAAAPRPPRRRGADAVRPRRAARRRGGHPAPGLPDVAGPAGALGLHPPDDGVDPTGAGVAFDTPVLAASGRLARRPSGDYAGNPRRASHWCRPRRSAVPDLGGPASFAVVLSATFPPPGVQIGLGFALTGVGGPARWTPRGPERAAAGSRRRDRRAAPLPAPWAPGRTASSACSEQGSRTPAANP